MSSKTGRETTLTEAEEHDETGLRNQFYQISDGDILQTWRPLTDPLSPAIAMLSEDN